MTRKQKIIRGIGEPVEGSSIRNVIASRGLAGIVLERLSDFPLPDRGICKHAVVQGVYAFINWQERTKEWTRAADFQPSATTYSITKEFRRGQGSFDGGGKRTHQTVRAHAGSQSANRGNHVSTAIIALQRAYNLTLTTTRHL
jgi:hypothetical protein